MDDKKSRKWSVYWNHFKELDVGKSNGGPRKAKCEHCFQVLSIGPGCTGNLARHLRHKHPLISMMLQEQNESQDQNETTEIEYETEDGQKFSEVYLLDGSGDELSEPETKKTPDTKKRKYTSEPLNNTVTKVSNSSHSFFRSNTEDKFDVFGRLVAMKMRSLNNTQRIIAEKIINDTLTEAELENLNKYCGLNIVQIKTVEADCKNGDVVASDE